MSSANRYTRNGQLKTDMQVSAAAISKRRVYLVLFTLLCIVHILLPIERGMAPVLSLGMAPVNFASFVTLLSFGVLFVLFGEPLRLNRFAILLILFCLSLLITTGLSEIEMRPTLISIYIVAEFFITHVLLFFVVECMVANGLQRRIEIIVLILGGLALGLGLLEAAGYRFPFYTDIYLKSLSPELVQYYINGLYKRLLGTLGNPILYGVLICSLFPFIFRMRRISFRILYTLCLGFTTYFANARTSLLLWAVYTMGFIIIFLRRIWIIFLLLICIAGIIGYLNIVDVGDNPQIEIVQSVTEFFFRDQGSGVVTRQQLWQGTLDSYMSENNFSATIFGSGLRGTNVVASDVLGSTTFNTIDNNFLTILYEAGLLGIALHYGAFVSVLRQGWGFMWKDMHWWSVLALIAAGVSFTIFRYQSVNFLFIVSLSIVVVKVRQAQEASRTSASVEDK